MEREFITHHIKDDSGLEHLIASMQLKKYSEDYSKHSTKHLENSKRTRSTRRRLQKYSTPAVLDYEELESLSEPEKRDCS